MKTSIEKLPPIEPAPTYTVTIEGLTERERELLRRIFGANITLPSYFITNFTQTTYEEGEVYNFLAGLAAGMDKR